MKPRWRQLLDVYITCRSSLWIVGVRRGIYVLGCLALLSGCTTTGRARAAVAREREMPHFHAQAQVLEPMIAFEAAVDAQLGAGGIEVETYALIKRWIGASLGVLKGPHPDDWTAVAREGWTQVRSAIGPYDRLQPFSRLIDKLIE